MTEKTEEKKTAAMKSRAAKQKFLAVASTTRTAIVLFALLFVYASIGGAVPFVLRSRTLEMTVMEWFTAWPFITLVALLCLNMIVATLRRVPFNAKNLGVWLSHSGILIMVFGSLFYFGLKQEGDTVIFRRRLVAAAVDRTPDAAELENSIVSLPGNKLELRTATDIYSFRIEKVFPEWKLRGGKHSGEKVYALWVSVTRKALDSGKKTIFTRKVIDGMPAETADMFLPSDTIDGKKVNLPEGAMHSYAEEVIGRRLVDKRLKLSLAYEPQDYYYITDTAAIYVRRKGSITGKWHQRPVRKLPRYNDYVKLPQEVFANESMKILPHDLDIDVPSLPEETGDPLAAIFYSPDSETTSSDASPVSVAAKMRITGFLPYATMQVRYRDSERDKIVINPYIRLELLDDGGLVKAYDLLALKAGNYESADGVAAFHWVRSTKDRDAFFAGSGYRIMFKRLGRKQFSVMPVPEKIKDGGEKFRPVPWSEYSYRVRFFARGPHYFGGVGDAALESEVAVDLKSSEKLYTRWVSLDPAKTYDAPSGRELSREKIITDPLMDVKLLPPPEITVISGHGDVGTWALFKRKGKIVREMLETGKPVKVSGSYSVVLKKRFEYAEKTVKPYVVPPRERVRSAGRHFSVVQVSIDFNADGKTDGKFWLPYNSYALPDATYRYVKNARPFFAFNPVTVKAPNGDRFELLFSRERFAFPHTVALDNFNMLTQSGGLTGAETSVKDWESILLFQNGDGWENGGRVRINRPLHYDGLTFFQSNWDRPIRSKRDGGYVDGLNFSGLGISTRIGIYIMLAGAVLSVLGMAYTFYAKPFIKR